MCRSAVLLFFFCLSFPLFAQDISAPEGMILIQNAVFQMGIEESELDKLAEMGKDVPHMSMVHSRWWFADEMPIHTVVLDSFYIDISEVTNNLFSLFVDSTNYNAEGNWKKYSCKERENHPVINITWNDATAYAEWAGKRLPTEEEWEYAAGGGQEGFYFPWGNEPDQGMANYRYWGETFWAGTWRLLGLRKLGTTEVGSYPPNGFGLYDMIGNVSEWIANYHRPYPDSVDLVDPYHKYGPWGDDPPDYNKKVVRGGSWETPNAVFLRITYRSGISAESYSCNRGFRCVKNID